MNLLAPNLFTIPAVLSPQECADFIARGEGRGFESASVGTAGGPRMMTNVRNNDRAIFDDPALADFLWDRVRGHVPREFNGEVVVGLNERFRYYRYDPSQRFNAHRDGVVERSPTERSRQTFMMDTLITRRAGLSS